MTSFIKGIRSFILVQTALMTTFLETYPDCKDFKFLLDFPKKGYISLDGIKWKFIKHGLGFLFISEVDGQEVDVRREINTLDAFDLNRIEQYFETTSQLFDVLEDRIQEAIASGQIEVIDQNYKLLKLINCQQKIEQPNAHK